MLSSVPLLWAALAGTLGAAQSPDSALVASFSAVRSAAARFRQDLPRASQQLVLSRAHHVRAACANSRTAADALAATRAPTGAGHVGLAALQRALDACQRDWDTTGARVRADSLRAWGPFRLSELERALRRYQRDRFNPAPG